MDVLKTGVLFSRMPASEQPTVLQALSAWWSWYFLQALKEPYNSSHAHPRALTPQEEAVLRSLRMWYRKPDAQQLGASGYLRTIRTVSSADYWDLHCLVLDTDYRSQSDGRSIIWVWDGHDARPFPHG